MVDQIEPLFSKVTFTLFCHCYFDTLLGHSINRYKCVHSHDHLSSYYQPLTCSVLYRAYIYTTFCRFLSKLLHFYNPGAENSFCTIRLDDPQARIYTSIGLLLLEKILFINAEESHRHLCSLLVDICHSLSEVCGCIDWYIVSYQLERHNFSCCPIIAV